MSAFQTDSQGVICPLCFEAVVIPIEEMLAATYRMNEGTGEITLVSAPSTLTAHLESHA